jgi:S1-C subfamily serine protease
MTNMEDLSKHQLILLTLLVSFVTSIATGVITFTLLQEAPVEVTQTINRVVERTIEKVTPAEVQGGKEIVREVQVVNEEDLVLGSIEKSAKSIVRIKAPGFDGSEIVTGLGLVVGNSGVIVTDSRSVANGTSFKVVFADGKSYSTAESWTEGGLTFLNVGMPSGEKYTFYPASLGKSDALKLGQTIIAVAGKDSNSVSISRISKLDKDQAGKVTEILTDISNSRTQRGSPLLNINGEVVGLEAPAEEGSASLSYYPVSKIQASLVKALEELKK